MIFYWLCIITGIVALCLFLSNRCKESTAKAAILKSITSIIFVCTAITAYTTLSVPPAVDGTKLLPGDNFAFPIIAGLVFGMLGDIWLDLKFVHKSDETIYTFAGFYSFAAGHALFIVSLIKNFADFKKPLYIIIPIILGIAMGFATVLGGKLMKLDYGKYKAVSIFYGSILISMTLLSISFAIMNSFKNMTLNMMSIGGIFFLISDLILCGTYFGEGKNRKIDIITNHVTYYIAQFVIASSILFLN